MLFNSYEFAVFFPIVFVIYWLLRSNLRVQNVFLIIASFVFYGWWSLGFLGLMILSSSTDFIVGVLLDKYENERQRKLILLISLGVNLGILFFFKYFNFFVDSFISAFTLFGKRFDRPSLSVVLPVGISFYTFQAMSYTIDVFRRKAEPTKDPVIYFAFISFFPQLVAGPIERAGYMLPQFLHKRRFDYALAVDGMRQILAGLFKKVVIADNCSPFVNHIFQNYGNMSADQLIIGAFLFSIQIYCDFSGYSDIALGTAKLLGFKLMRNFSYPYFSRDIAEFWRRWHISLTRWFKDYVYIPLGGSRSTRLIQIRNIFIIFILSGIWHGANWTFVAWGVWNALLFLPLLLSKKNRSHLDDIAAHRALPSLREFFQMVSTFLLVMLGWIFFRSATIHDAVIFLGKMIMGVIKEPRSLLTAARSLCSMSVFAFIIILFVLEWIQRTRLHILDFQGAHVPVLLRRSVYALMLFLLVWFSGKPQMFIYFQF